jgi:hypothetical protein
MSSTLARIEVRVSAALKEELTLIAKERGCSLSDMAASALQTMLEGPGQVDTPTSGVDERLQRLERLLEVFIKTYFSITPEVPDAQKPAAAARGRARWQQFQRLVQDRGGHV